MPPRIVLLAVNARFSHTAHGIRSLAANLGDLRETTRLLEFDLHAEPGLIAAQVLELNPDLLGCSVYIWNVTLMEEVVRRLRAEGFAGRILCGGPEAGYLPASHALIELTDYRVTGEGEDLFPELCRRLLSGDPPEEKHHAAEPPDVAHIALPYDEYTDADLAHRMLYVEASRGCPFHCDYCLSSLDGAVRFFPLDRLLPAFEDLIARGARRFKFLDRCFNIRDDHALAILQFFLKRNPEGMIIHLEVIPDRISPAFLETMRAFPPGTLHIEAGIQTYDPDVAKRIQRRCDVDAADTNLRHLVQAGAVVHADLIAGLPGETLEGFGRGFDRLWKTGAQEIQVGILKRLHGAPMDRHSEPWGMQYNENPPYEVLQTSSLTAEDIRRLKQFADFWERLHNRGQFPATMALIAEGADSLFSVFMKLSDALSTRFQRTHGIPMLDLIRGLLEYLTTSGRSTPETARALLADFLRDGHRNKPPRYLVELAEGMHATQTASTRSLNF